MVTKEMDKIQRTEKHGRVLKIAYATLGVEKCKRRTAQQQTV